MSIYDNDSRVRRERPGYLHVDVDGERFGVGATDLDRLTDWYANAFTHTRAYRQGRVGIGPFPTADEAIASLIGPPR